jgi:hypothetical protein
MCKDARSPSESVAQLEGHELRAVLLCVLRGTSPQRRPNPSSRQTVKKKENLSNFNRSAKLVLPFDRTRNRDPSSRFVPRPCFLCMVKLAPLTKLYTFMRLAFPQRCQSCHGSWTHHGGIRGSGRSDRVARVSRFAWRILPGL